MPAWPAHCDEKTADKDTGKDKAQGKKVEAPWRYPVRDHGTLAAATLERKQNKRYDWVFAAEKACDYRLVSDGPIEVFPPTRPKLWQSPKATVLQRAEQGAHFLRTYYPDVDIPAELIREEITRDDQYAKASENNVPSSGSPMDIVSFNLARKNMEYLAFPMGETGCQLNLSIINGSNNLYRDRGLKPSVIPVHTFPTPIQQLLATPHLVGLYQGKYPILGVRTMGLTSFLRVKTAISGASHVVETTPIVEVQRSDVGDKEVIDVAVSSRPDCLGYVANEAGDIFRCRIPEASTIIDQVYTSTTTDKACRRLAVCANGEKILTTHNGIATMIDIRDSKRSSQVYSIPRPDVKFTFIESLDDDDILRLVSTEELMWFDQRNTRKPLLAAKHGRDYDLTLRSYSRVLSNGVVTFLTSQRNSLVTVYDVSSQHDDLVRMCGAPYALPPILRPDGPHLGYAVHQPVGAAGNKSLRIFQLSSRGAVSVMNLDHVPVGAMDIKTGHAPRRADYSEEVQKMSKDVDALHVDEGTFVTRAHSIVNMNPQYQQMFVHREEQDLAAASNAVCETLERMPRFWQDTDAPVEHSLTTFDIAMRSGKEPSESSRNDWFTGSSLDSAAGYRACGQGRIPRDQLARRSPWHLDISPFIRAQVPEFDDDPQKTAENLARFDLAEGSSRTADSFRRESEACSQVALDLSLATDVYSSFRPGADTPATFDDDMLSISLSTRAMSLASIEPPPVHFGFLRPTQSNAHRQASQEDIVDKVTNAEDEEESASDSKASVPLGVRLLLQEWDVGIDPFQYVYRDPYGDESPAPAQVRRAGKQPEQRTAPGGTIPALTPAQRPPVIASSTPHVPPVIATSHPAGTRRPLAAGRSLDAAAFQSQQRLLNGESQPTDTWVAPPASQEAMASTQVLPGPHGGRTVAGKKKAVKKRLGGF